MFSHKFLSAFAAVVVFSSAANAATFNVVLETDTVDGSGVITIDDALISPNAVVNYLNPLVSASLSFDGIIYDAPFDESPIGGDTVFIFDDLGEEIISVDDQTPVGSSFTDFRSALNFNLGLAFEDGPVPGTFITFDLSAPDGQQIGLSGTFSIERVSVSEVPLPAPAMLLLGSLLGLAGLRGSKKV